MAVLLIIDEYAGFREVMGYCLPGFGHCAVGAVDGGEARRIARERRVDVVLVDAGRRGEGFKTCADFKQDERLKHLPVVIMSNLLTRDAATKAAAVGAASIVTKPFEWESFLSLIERLTRAGGAPPPAAVSPP